MNALPTRRGLLAGVAASTLCFATGCAMSTRPSSSASTLLAPTGTLRASINLGNPILAGRAADGKARGVSVDLAQALADQLGVPLALLEFDAAAKSVDAVKSSRADIGFFEGAYLVRAGSTLTGNAEVDRAGTRVMVGRGSAYDLYLTRELKAASIVRAPTSPAVVDAFLAEIADVAAGVKQQLEADASRLGGLRLLPGRFMVIEQAMGIPAGRGEAAQAELRAFVEQVKSSGSVARSLQRHGVAGAVVAPAG